METSTSIDAEKYREQLEVRARIYLKSSRVELRVAQGQGGHECRADVHVREADRPGSQVDPSIPIFAGRGATVELALDELAAQLDAAEAARAIHDAG
ncbi:MAG: hypothetical protein ABW252_03555 [Polyangiales bacterium]